MDYFQIPAQELGRNAKIPVLPLGDSGEIFYELALEMVNTIKEHNARGEKTVFICPVGPVGQYPIFVRLVNRDRVSLKNCWFINMDEYLNDDGTYIDKASPLSFRGFMERTVYTKVDEDLLMPPEIDIRIDPADPGKVDRLIEELGGVDIAFGGIGINGHLAFNEAQPELTAEEFAALGTRVLTLTPETKTANAIGDRGGRHRRHAQQGRHHRHQADPGRPEGPPGGIPGLAPGRGPAGRLRRCVRLLPRDPSAKPPGRGDLRQRRGLRPAILRRAMGTRTLFTGGRVYIDGRFQEGSLLVEDGRIAAFGDLPAVGVPAVDLGGRMLVPGFLDLHTHGGDGVDVNAATAEDLGKIGPVFRPPWNHRVAVLCPHRHTGADPVVHRPGQGRHGPACGWGPAHGHPPGGALPVL